MVRPWRVSGMVSLAVRPGLIVGERHGVVVGAGESPVEPGPEPHRAGPVVGPVAQLHLGDITAAREQVHVEAVGVGQGGLQEVAEPHRPARPVHFDRHAPGVADAVGGIVEGAGRPDRPVEEVEARVVRVGVVVEDVLDGIAAGLDRDARYVALAGELKVVALDLLALAALPDGLAQEQARRRVARVGEVALRLAVGKAAGAVRLGEAGTLQYLGVVVELAALPQAHADGGRHCRGLAALAAERQALRAVIGRR